MSDKLYIVMPAYNEEANIETVVAEWHPVVENIGPDSRLVVVNDGSKDKTYDKLLELKEKYPQLEPVTKANSGHGATVLFAYNYALDHGADYIFQTDSDGQTRPDEFGPFWNDRKIYDAIIGHRNHRQDGFSRVFVTKTLKLVIRLVFGVSVTDANTPFRLMPRATLEKYLPKIPKDFNLSNVILSVLLVKNKDNVKFVPITFRPRQGGVNSINLKRIFKIGIQAVKDFRVIKKTM
ncbi:MAG: glycosyltransferase family 2 protein [Saccharofermentans sp.]|nr:glycosyltransferase family 2 protein [Saccharofermentans sp.]